MPATRADRTSLDYHLRLDVQTLPIRSQIIRATAARQQGMVFSGHGSLPCLDPFGTRLQI
jgi:hypothetical protein